MTNIMVLAKGVLQIVCSQSPLLVNCLSMKRGIIQSNIHVNLADPQRQTMNRNHSTILFTSNRASGNETVRTLT